MSLKWNSRAAVFLLTIVSVLVYFAQSWNSDMDRIEKEYPHQSSHFHSGKATTSINIDLLVYERGANQYQITGQFRSLIPREMVTAKWILPKKVQLIEGSTEVSFASVNTKQKTAVEIVVQADSREDLENIHLEVSNIKEGFKVGAGRSVGKVRKNSASKLLNSQKIQPKSLKYKIQQ